MGFTPNKRDDEKKYEAIFMKVPAPDSARKWLRRLTENPHVAGTEFDRQTADYVHARLDEFGFETEVVEYQAYLNYPVRASLRMIEPVEQEISLREDGVDLDKDSYSKDSFPSFHGYGASGKAKSQVIYVNYGTHDDFDRLESLGVSPEGKIVLARYGKVHRGLKVREAQHRGAAAIIIYSDPADDGYMKGDIYPYGPMRPESAIQRGSVHFSSEGAGDPTTPGWASKKGVDRMDVAKTRIPKIPSLPISYGQAAKILKALAGQRVPDDWQGGLPFAYHVGPGPAELDLDVETDFAIRPIWNVIGRIPGNEEKDRWVVLGNHRDAWTYGAVDPNSGTAAFLEAARGLGEAQKAGWRPRRTILFASWDGEEYGLVGSTEWAEDHAQELQQKTVAYINLDSAVPGPDLEVGGIPSLRDLMMEVAGDVPEPREGGSLLDAWQKKKRQDWAATAPVDLQNPDSEFYLHLDPLGSGSDFATFVHFLGIACINFGFDGPYGVYHSIYDNSYWMEHFGDPEFLYHIAASRLYGLLAMRLAGADVVPMRYSPYALQLKDQFDIIRRKIVVDRRKYDPSNSKKNPPLNPDFNELAKTLDALQAAANNLDEVLNKMQDQNISESTSLTAWNDSIVQIERAFLDPDGLPKRNWFKHTLVAPGYTLGYGPWVFPGVMQALEDRDATLLDTEMNRLITHLQAGTTRLQETTNLISPSP